MIKVIRDFVFVTFFVGVIYIFASLSKFDSKYWPTEISIKEVALSSSDSVLIQSDSLVIPVIYNGKPDFRGIDDTEDHKKAFIHYLLPSIVIVRNRLLDDLHHVEFIEQKLNLKKSISEGDSLFLKSMKIKYETDSLKELKLRIYPQPVSLALVQAVLESGWGTSPIFRKGNNLFGVMSFSNDDARSVIPFEDGEDERYLRIYDSVIESIEHYFLLTSKLSSYKRFRQKRWEGAQSSELIKYISSYHESGQYVQMAQSILYSNELSKYDCLEIDPAYKSKPSLESVLLMK